MSFSRSIFFLIALAILLFEVHAKNYEIRHDGGNRRAERNGHRAAGRQSYHDETMKELAENASDGYADSAGTTSEKVASCHDTPKWSDRHGNDCFWYERHAAQRSCARFASELGSYSLSPLDACCVCGKAADAVGPTSGLSNEDEVLVASESNLNSKDDSHINETREFSDNSSPICEDFPQWNDAEGYDCRWYQENDIAGSCFNYGSGFPDANGVTAQTACCYCGKMSDSNGITSGISSNSVGAFSDLDQSSYEAAGWSVASRSYSDSNESSDENGTVKNEDVDYGPPQNAKAVMCQDTPIWSDGHGKSCEWYEFHFVDGSCPLYGDQIGKFGMSAQDACCVCRTDSEYSLSWSDEDADSYEEEGFTSDSHLSEEEELVGVYSDEDEGESEDGDDDDDDDRASDSSSGEEVIVKNIGIVRKPASTCQDIPRWTDRFGYHCSWYQKNAERGTCDTFGKERGRDGLSAQDACCVCGKDAEEEVDSFYDDSLDTKSESNAPSDEEIVDAKSTNTSNEALCQDIPRWSDIDGYHCDWYARHTMKGSCTIFGGEPGANGLSAQNACCACGKHLPSNKDTDEPPGGEQNTWQQQEEEKQMSVSNEGQDIANNEVHIPGLSEQMTATDTFTIFLVSVVVVTVILFVAVAWFDARRNKNFNRELRRPKRKHYDSLSLTL